MAHFPKDQTDNEKDPFEIPIHAIQNGQSQIKQVEHQPNSPKIKHKLHESP
jgi:hypothetical protein